MTLKHIASSACSTVAGIAPAPVMTDQQTPDPDHPQPSKRWAGRVFFLASFLVVLAALQPPRSTGPPFSRASFTPRLNPLSVRHLTGSRLLQFYGTCAPLITGLTCIRFDSLAIPTSVLKSPVSTSASGAILPAFGERK